ncbi:glycosyltransferase [Oceanibium sediminis]|uniref:glycosyltransferase n=1 Tax=Oceanibium sediminis TaxID=2026339 RepID=UPI000DD40452|nr:glycosyltransferase [Oceanibium sediminis]
MRICFVALEVLGPFNGGGIATALAGQAEHHAKQHDVTILYVNRGLKPRGVKTWEDSFAARGIRFVYPEFDAFYQHNTIAKRSFAIKEYLEEHGQDYDVIYFHDYLGLGYYTALSRRLGLGFANTLIGTVIHGPSEWARTLNLVTERAADISLYEMERKQTELSDFTVAPSQHIIDWCVEQGWRMPDDSRPLSNLLPHRVDLHSGLVPGQRHENISEICYFGRLEIRKGFFTFLDAIKYLHKNNLKLPRKITFLGGFCTNGDRNSASTVLEYAESWDIEIQFLNNYDHEVAITYLVDNKPLTVIPSMDESFGLTAYECLKFGIPALISDRGALSTLPDRAQAEEVLFSPRANTLGNRIHKVLNEGITIAGINPVHLSATKDWDALLADLAAKDRVVDPWGATVTIDDMRGDSLNRPPRPLRDGKAPLVSAILVHHNRPDTFRDALNSLRNQTYENLEIIVVDDGSTEANLSKVRRMVNHADDPRISLVTQHNRYLGAARNFGVSWSSGEYLLFMDDDNFAHPEEVETFVTVAQNTGADVLNTISRLFRTVGQDRVPYDLYIPVGPSLSLALFQNTFGDANALVSRRIFDEVGGFTEEYGLGCEDYEFFTKAFLAGAQMQLVPELIFDYRADDESMMKELNSGKYIINQTRGVRALFETHHAMDLAQMRGIMRVGFHTAIANEYSYWVDQSIRGRRHADFEDRLLEEKNKPNGREACKAVVQLLAANGRIREAIAFMERNNLPPDESVVHQMRSMLVRHERRALNQGMHQNAIVNGGFDFWIYGTRHEGVAPYQLVANDWFISSSKRRGTMIVSQQTDTELYGLGEMPTGRFMRIELARPDPQGYAFLCQRMMEFGTLVQNEIDLRFLVRATRPGAMSVFLRVTYEHGSENFEDVWPEKSAWLSEIWQDVRLRFDLTPYAVAGSGKLSFVTLFIKLPLEEAITLDLADVTVLPHGAGAMLQPYMRENERIRAETRVFTFGKGARVLPMGDGVLRITPPEDFNRDLGPGMTFTVASSVVLTLQDGAFLEINCAQPEWVRDADAPGGGGFIQVKSDRQIGQPGTAMGDFLIVANYPAP